MPHIFLYIKYFITGNACLQGFRANSLANLRQIHTKVRIYSRSILYLLALANLCAVKSAVHGQHNRKIGGSTMAKGENIFKRKDGRWEARCVKGYQPSGKIKYGFCYGKSYKEAKEKVTKLKSAVATGDKALKSSFHQKRSGIFLPACAL